MTIVIFGLLLFENQRYLFATPLHENTDQASDSLMVREAKHTFMLHGHYSQWRFYHPGPALLDTLAAGEGLFYDELHLVPTPYNGQLILLCLVLTLFFSLALSIFARELGSGGGGYIFFLPLALFFAVWHYGSVGGEVFLDAWPAYPPVMTLLCFMVVTAAVGAGRGWYLPLVAVTGGWLVHNHVAQPLLVVPLTLLAYTGLLTSCWRRPEATAATPRETGGFFTAGWRAFPWAHRTAAALLALFVLPLFLDALHGGDSNFAHIMEFVRTHPGPGKKFVRSLCYFLTFGGYGPYQPGTRDFARYSAPGMFAFVRLHWMAYAFWIVALLGAPTLFRTAGHHRKKHGEADGSPGHGRFLAWFYVVLTGAWGLTLVWGMRQEGVMYYYNSYFNYSIFFGLALGLAAALSLALTAWTRFPPARGARLIISVLLWAGVVGSAVIQTHRFQVFRFGTPGDEAVARSIENAAATLPEGAVCYLDCRPWENWPDAIAVVLELERLGRKVRVNDNWEIIFGNPNTIQHETITGATPLARWRVVTRTSAPPRANQWPLYADSLLDVKSLSPINPDGQTITFTDGGNYDDFAIYGWSTPEGNWTWSDQTNALLAFRPQPLPAGSAGVDLVLDAWTSPPPGKQDTQRVVIRFNDNALGTFHLPLAAPGRQPVRIRISAAQWQAAQAKGEARLQFYFPDAQSPSSLGLGTDRRRLGGGFHSLEFQPVTLPGGGTRPPDGPPDPPRQAAG